MFCAILSGLIVRGSVNDGFQMVVRVWSGEQIRAPLFFLDLASTSPLFILKFISFFPFFFTSF